MHQVTTLMGVFGPECPKTAGPQDKLLISSTSFSKVSVEYIIPAIMPPWCVTVGAHGTTGGAVM